MSLGILAGAMGGAAEGVGQSAQEQMKTNQLVDIEKQMSNIREEKELRIDSVRRDRDVADVGRMTQAKADAAPIAARGEANALNTMATTPGYIENEGKIALAKGAAGIRSSEISAGASKYAADSSAATQRYVADSGHQSQADLERMRQNAPTLIPQADGTYAVREGTKVSGVLEFNGKPLVGPKDLDARTKALVESKLAEMRTAFTPEERRALSDDISILINGSHSDRSLQPRPNDTPKPGFTSGLWNSVTGSGAGNAPTGPTAAGAAQAPAPTNSQVVTGIPDSAEKIGLELDTARKDMEQMMTRIPSVRQQAANPQALPQWKAKQDDLRGRINRLEEQYRAAIPPAMAEVFHK